MVTEKLPLTLLRVFQPLCRLVSKTKRRYSRVNEGISCLTIRSPTPMKECSFPGREIQLLCVTILHTNRENSRDWPFLVDKILSNEFKMFSSIWYIWNSKKFTLVLKIALSIRYSWNSKFLSNHSRRRKTLNQSLNGFWFRVFLFLEWLLN